MSRATSATTGRRYGLKRVCRTWERSRSALYARRSRFDLNHASWRVLITKRHAASSTYVWMMFFGYSPIPNACPGIRK